MAWSKNSGLEAQSNDYRIESRGTCEDMLNTTIIVSAIFAGVVATAVTIAIEKWGGVVGGVLGTVPSTILPASIGMYLVSSETEFFEAMAIIPFGMMLNASFLGVWILIPSYFSEATSLLFKSTVASLLFWLFSGLLLLFLLDVIQESIDSQFSLGLLGLFCLLVVVFIFNKTPVPAPAGSNKVSIPMLVSRGCMASVAIGIAVLLSNMNQPYLAGLASVFPAIFLTSMVALWISQGPSVPRGAAGPMMVGGTSVALFALFAMVTYPKVGVWYGALISWIGAVLLWSLPIFLLLHHRQKRIVENT